MSTQNYRAIFLCVCLILLAVSAGSQNMQAVQAASPLQPDTGIAIPYSGQLNDNTGKPVVEGTYAFEFRLYSSAEGGESLWTEVQDGVLVRDGLFSVSLGSTSPVPQEVLSEGTVWLGVAVRGPDEGQFTALNPHQRLNVSTPATSLSVSAGMTCAHDHFGEQWTGDSNSSGLYVKNTNGTGGAGIVANSESGAALSIEKGSLQVKNAGRGTDTPVFIHQVKTTGNGANLCTKGWWDQNWSTVIDHPLTNGNPEAILLITPNYGLSSSGHTGPAHAPYGVYYDDNDQCEYGNGKWVIYAYDTTPLLDGQMFNVLVVVP